MRFTNIISARLLTILLTSCSSTSMTFLTTESKITVGSGPEDMVIDRSTEDPRLLISCTNRRDGESPFGEIVAYAPATGKADTLVRVGVPENLSFHPHGIFLDSSVSPQLLYAISHERDDKYHPVYVFEVGNDSLVFKEVISTELLHSPNALTLGPNGEIFIVNDSGKRGSLLEKVLKLNRANVLRLSKDEQDTWQAEIAAEGLGYPAGINRIGSTLYIGDAVNHKLHLFTIQGEQLIPREPIEGLKGNDNIRVADGMLYVAGHVKPFKFIAHAKSSANLSPVKVWRIDPLSKEITTLYYTEGSAISAGSSAVMLNGKLYVCQVFDPYILEVTFE